MKNKFFKSVLIFVLSFISFYHSAYAVTPIPEEFEERLEEAKQTVPEFELRECQKIVEIYDYETLSFLKFLEQHFQNKSSTSSLANIAIAKYSQYKNAINSIFAELAPEASSEELDRYETAYSNYSKCIKITNTYIDLTKDILMMHIKNNTTQKKTTILLEKYHALNNRLRDLNMAVAEMYSFFATLNNKLPGFLKECITS
ncbi:hypothetical protein GF366_00205 [Candidatus Peregrinibacteria bacterium]|nr:hypothetical protein [Candidatus Peregrinibacteria bacterium]